MSIGIAQRMLYALRDNARRLGFSQLYTPLRPMEKANMSFAVRLSRVALTAIALVLGSLGIFCLYGSCIGAPLAADAIVCLASATAIVLACPATDAR